MAPNASQAKAPASRDHRDNRLRRGAPERLASVGLGTAAARRRRRGADRLCELRSNRVAPRARLGDIRSARISVPRPRELRRVSRRIARGQMRTYAAVRRDIRAWGGSWRVEPGGPRPGRAPDGATVDLRPAVRRRRLGRVRHRARQRGRQRLGPVQARAGTQGRRLRRDPQGRRRPPRRTWLRLTDAGRAAFAGHVAALQELANAVAVVPATATPTATATT